MEARVHRRSATLATGGAVSGRYRRAPQRHRRRLRGLCGHHLGGGAAAALVRLERRPQHGVPAGDADPAAEGRQTTVDLHRLRVGPAAVLEAHIQAGEVSAGLDRDHPERGVARVDGEPQEAVGALQAGPHLQQSVLQQAPRGGVAAALLAARRGRHAGCSWVGQWMRKQPVRQSSNTCPSHFFSKHIQVANQQVNAVKMIVIRNNQPSIVHCWELSSEWGRWEWTVSSAA